MRIGIEASAAVERSRSGVGNYTAHLIGALQRLAAGPDGWDLLLFSNRGRHAAIPGADELEMPIYMRDRLPLRMLWMQAGLPRSIARTRPDLCHFPNHLAPVCLPAGVPFVVTIHDMSVFRCPEHHPLKTVAVHRAIIPAVARRASVVVTVSESARRDIQSYLDLPPDRVRVIHEGINPRFQGERDEDAVARVRRLYGLSYPYVLSVGTVEPRKNHGGLIAAFARLVLQEHLPHHLVIVGPRGWKESGLLQVMRTCGVAERIHFLGYVPEAHLPSLYQGAEAFAFPSWYEGFGLPVLEALASGVPTLISHDPALCEVAGAGTTLIADPASADDMAAGLHRLLTDVPLRQRLSALGRRRAGQFSWERCAAETCAAYRDAMLSDVKSTQRQFRRVGTHA